MIPVSEKLPDYTDFVWVKRESSEMLKLGFHSSGEFQNPYTVGDSEGLSVEYFHDVTHWAELQVPCYTQGHAKSDFERRRRMDIDAKKLRAAVEQELGK